MNARWVALRASKDVPHESLILFAPWWVRLALRLGTPAKEHRVITGEPCIIWRGYTTGGGG